MTLEEMYETRATGFDICHLENVRFKISETAASRSPEMGEMNLIEDCVGAAVPIHYPAVTQSLSIH